MKMDKKQLLKQLNVFLKHNTRAKKAQNEFENSLKKYIGLDDFYDVMDVYIDMDISGAPGATDKDIEIIIEQARKL